MLPRLRAARRRIAEDKVGLLSAEVAALSEALTPRLDIDYNEGETTYYQCRQLFNLEWMPNKRIPYYERVFRVAARNLSAVTVRNVQLFLVAATGRDHVGIVPNHRLLVMDTGAGAADVHRSDEPRVFFDVAIHTLEPDVPFIDDLHIRYAIGHVGESLPTDPGTEWELKLQLQGEDVPPVTASFRLWIDEENVAHLSRASSAEEQAL